MITGKTQLLGVVGHPVEYSLYPDVHHTAIAIGDNELMIRVRITRNFQL